MPPVADVLRNPLRRPLAGLGPADPAVAELHRRMPGYAPTPLVDATEMAARLGLSRVFLKVESSRMELPAFKILGASWAVYRALTEHIGTEAGPWPTINELALRLAPLRPFTLAAATDGNHGRAVARMAHLLGFSARIFVPEGTAPARIEAIEGEGAEVIVVEGDYDSAVARSAEEAGHRCLVISDTSWPGYESVPAWVIEGYATIFAEVDEASSSPVGVVMVPVGVGALAAAAVRHYRRPEATMPVLVGVEPTSANCVQESARAGEMVTVPGPHSSIMAGLNCGSPSPVAWPLVSGGFDWFVSIHDDWARLAMRELAGAGVVAGETGAAALGGLLALLDQAPPPGLEIGPDTTALVLCTEGATDSDAYHAIVGRRPEEVQA